MRRFSAHSFRNASCAVNFTCANSPRRFAPPPSKRGAVLMRLFRHVLICGLCVALSYSSLPALKLPPSWRHMRPAKGEGHSRGYANSTSFGRRFLMELAQAERIFCGFRRIAVAWNVSRRNAPRASKTTFNSLHSERLPCMIRVLSAGGNIRILYEGFAQCGKKKRTIQPGPRSTVISGF